MSAELVHIDVETTGLDITKHDICEVAWAVGKGPVKTGKVLFNAKNADPEAMEINKFYEREGSLQPLDYEDLLLDLHNATLVGMNIAFDVMFLRKLLGYEPWHYRKLDIESYAMATIGLTKLPSSKDIQRLLIDEGYTLDYESDHSAKGDVLSQREVFGILYEISTGASWFRV